MLRKVGLPVAFRPRSPLVAEAAGVSLSRSLTGLLDVAGVRRPSVRKAPIRRPASAGPRLAPVAPEAAGYSAAGLPRP